MTQPRPAASVDALGAPRTNLQLDDLDVFVRVIERLSMSAAAKVLGVPKSTVSRAINRLEDSLRVRLIQRTSRALAPTDAGRVLYEQALPHIVALRSASEVVSEQGGTAQGVVRITAPNDIGIHVLAPALELFRRSYPEVTFDVVLTTRTVDLVAEGFDLAIRGGVLRDSSLVARKLADTKLFACATPAYLARRGTPTQITTLKEHDCILFRGARGAGTWNFETRGVPSSVDVTGCISSEDFSFVLASVRAGLGIGMIPSFMCEAELSRGELVRLFSDAVGQIGPIYLVHASGRHLPRRVALVRDLLVETFRKL